MGLLRVALTAPQPQAESELTLGPPTLPGHPPAALPRLLCPLSWVTPVRVGLHLQQLSSVLLGGSLDREAMTPLSEEKPPQGFRIKSQKWGCFGEKQERFPGFPSSTPGQPPCPPPRSPPGPCASGDAPILCGASLVAQTVKNPPAMRERAGFDPWVGKIPWRRKYGNPLQYSFLFYFY